VVPVPSGRGQEETGTVALVPLPGSAGSGEGKQDLLASEEAYITLICGVFQHIAKWVNGDRPSGFGA
jgi:hypothetical protein